MNASCTMCGQIMNLEYSYAGLTLYAEIHDFAKGAVHILYTLQNRN